MCVIILLSKAQYQTMLLRLKTRGWLVAMLELIILMWKKGQNREY